MGQSIKIAGATFTNFFSSLTLPDRTGLVGEYLFGGDATASCRNRANPGSPATVVPSTAGSPVSPTYDDASALVQTYETTAGSWGFNLGFASGDQGTVIAVSRHVSGSLTQVISTDAGPIYGTIGAVGLYDNGEVRRMRGGARSGSVQVNADADLAAAGPTQYLFAAGTYVKGTSTTIFGYANGTLVKTVNSDVSITYNTSPFLVGGLSGINGNRGSSRVAYVAAFSRVLSDADIDAAYEQIKAFMVTRGIEVS